MKHPLLALALAMLTLAPILAEAGERTVSFTVEGMTCFLCPATVRKAMGSVPGVSSVRVDRRAGRAVATFDDRVATPERIAKASSDAGYPATPVPEPAPQ